MSAESILLVIAFLLFCALVIAITFERETSREADRLATERDRLQRKVEDLQKRNADLRDELSARACHREPTLTEAVTATIAELPLTHPGDTR